MISNHEGNKLLQMLYRSKTLTTLTVILPNGRVAAEWVDTVNSHLEFMIEKSYQDGPLKLIQYFVS